MSYLLLPITLLTYLPSIHSQDISFPTSAQDTHFSPHIPTIPNASQSNPSNVQYTPQAAASIPQYQYPDVGNSQGFSGAVGGAVSGGWAGGYEAGFGGGEGGYGGDVPGGVMDLGMMIHRIARSQGGKNWVYSPTSIASALYLVLLGSNGKTYTEISRLLGINSLSSSMKPHEDFAAYLRNFYYTGHQNNIIKLANGLFLQNDFSIRQDYRDLTNSFYQSSLMSLDFRNNGSYARDVINSWVVDKTMGKITEILSEIPSPDTKLVLTSSLYFKGEWSIPFPSELTKMQNFYPNGRYQPTNTKVPMMATQGTFRYYYDPTLNCEVVGIPYKGENIIFYLVLPQNSNKETLKTLENQLNSTEFQRLSENTIPTNNIILAIPKMKLTSEYLLNSVLHELGLRSLFDPREADLSLISSPEQKPGPQGSGFEEEQFVFTRMKKDNVSEQRSRRFIEDQSPDEERNPFVVFEEYDERKKRSVENMEQSLRTERFGRQSSLQAAEQQIKDKRKQKNNLQNQQKPSSNKLNLKPRPKRQIKMQTPTHTQNLVPLTRTDNTLDPSRLVRNQGNGGLYVNQIIHKVVIDINEKGTEAAATTIVAMVKTLSHTVKADAPFLFFIRHESSRMILFWGSVVEP